jgi:hypothetical protein
LNALWDEQHNIEVALRADKASKTGTAAELLVMQADLEPAGPVVQAGYMEADLKQQLLYPIYWPGEAHSLLRGTWFAEVDKGKVIPLPHGFATKLELHWQEKFALNPSTHFFKDLPPIKDIP